MTAATSTRSGSASSGTCSQQTSLMLQVESYEGWAFDHIFDDSRGANMTTLSVRYRF